MSEPHSAREVRPTLRDHLRERQTDPVLEQALDAIALATKAIAHKVRRARIEGDVIGIAGGDNVHGEAQQKLDVLSNRLLLERLRGCTAVAWAASEEEERAVRLHEAGSLAVIFDPLDGSSNIDVAAGVGTIFSVLEVGPGADEAAVLASGRAQRAAGYVLYGSSVLLVLTLGDGVDVFVLDPTVGEFLRVIERLRLPESKRVYSLNEAYVNDFPVGYQHFLDFAHGSGFASRYIGSMVADVHRTLIQGGVFLYPPTHANPSGKLRLLYEANPMALLIEQAGGTASTGTGRILDEPVQTLHQRTPVVLGSPVEVEGVLKHL